MARAIGHALRDALLPANRPARLGLALFLAGLLATGVATVRTVQDARAQALARFQSKAERLEGAVVRRLHRAEQVLLVAAAADTALGGFDRTRFRAYVKALEAAGELQPVQGLGWIERVGRDQLPAFVDRQRADAAPRFSVRTDASTNDLLVVTKIEPLERGGQAWGLDVAVDGARRDAALRAIDTGQLSLSAPLHLLNDRQRVGWMMIKPVYRGGLPLDTPAQRRAALRGLLYAPMVASDLLSPVRGAFEESLQFELFDGLASARPPIYESRTPVGAPGPARDEPGRATVERRLDVGGRVLTLRVGSSLRSADAWIGGSSVAFGGLALSLLLALVLVRVLQATERAESRSRRMQQDLQRMHELTQHTTGVLLGLDARLRVRWVNAGFTLITGWAETDCVGQPVTRLARAAEGAMELPQAADRLRHGASHLRIELVAARKDGSPCWLDADLQAEGDGFLLTAADITGRREAERRLAENEHMMRLMTDSIDARLTYWDTDLRCRLANRTAARFANRRRSQLLGMSLVDIMGAHAFRELAPRLQRALAGEPQRFEWTWPGGDGRDAVSLIQYIPDIDGGHVRGVFAFALDITELKEAQRTALRANEAKSQFLSHMSHEIRTPMNAILGMLALLRGTGLDRRQGDFAGKAEAAARSLLGLLNDLLDLSKIESGKMQLDPAPFRPDLLLRDLAAILDGAAHARDLRLAFELDPAIPPVLVGDDMRLRQVLVNLGGNAVKFTPSGEVVVAVRLLQRHAGHARIEVSVRDTGIGIAPQDQERIFGDFSQAASSTTREYGGTGLGLGICRRLVSMMGGQLWLESRPGHGSRFWFELTLPVAAEDSVPSLDHVSVPAEVTGGDALAGLRLLVVEDNPVNQQVARELLSAQGAHVTLAGDGAQAVRCVETAARPFDAVLMDVQMPVMDGWAAAREIRTRLGDATTPIIAMTANAMPADRQRSQEAGMDHHVSKPFDLPVLVEVLRQCTGRGAQAPVIAAAPPPAGLPWSRTAALARLGGDVELLARMLPLFRTNLRNSAERLEALRGDTPPQEAVALFHTLRGMAGAMGADELASRAGDAERRLRDGTGDAPDRLALPVRAALAGALGLLDAAS